MKIEKPIKVYIRDFKTRSVLKEIDVTRIVGTSNYERFLLGLIHQMNTNKYFVDESEVSHAEAGND